MKDEIKKSWVKLVIIMLFLVYMMWYNQNYYDAGYNKGLFIGTIGNHTLALKRVRETNQDSVSIQDLAEISAKLMKLQK